mgnify:CR=1 FL=1
MEITYDTALNTKNWIDGYSSYSGRSIYMDTGDAAGCPTSGGNYTASTSCASGGKTWTINDVHYKAWGAAPAYPLPQIYTNSGSQAFQWQRISRYGYDFKGGSINIRGTLSQWQACQQTNAAECIAQPNGTDNQPVDAYNKLQDKLNADSATAQIIEYATDVKWYYQ